MTDEVISLNQEFATFADLPVADVLAGAAQKDLQHVLVLGRTVTGELYAASSTADTALCLYMLEQFRAKMFGDEKPFKR